MSRTLNLIKDGYTCFKCQLNNWYEKKNWNILAGKSLFCGLKNEFVCHISFLIQF